MTTPQITQRGRIDAIDVARGVALVAMATYHFAWDLEFFGYLAPSTSGTGPLKWYARSIAASFLFLVGVSLVLAHGSGVRWPAFWRRWIKVTAAALLITLVTWFATPQTFVFFGILHQIAFASIAGLLFLALPWWFIALSAVAILIGTPMVQTDGFASPLMWWTGLSSIQPRSNDFVPVLPWFAAVLAGMAGAKLVLGRSVTPRPLMPGGWTANHRPTRLLALFGRWSLTFYLVHQPILIGLVYLATLIAPPQAPSFGAACVQQCTTLYGQSQCETYCACTQIQLEAAGKMEALRADPNSARTDLETATIIAQCTFEAGIEVREPQQ